MRANPPLELTMLPDPLHPAVVHFPIVLMFLLPLAAVFALWRIRRGARTRPAWALAVAGAAALSASAWLAVETGEADEEGVERVVAEEPLESHEEAAERFLLLTGGVLVISGAGLLGGRTGAIARLAATATAVGLVVAGAQVGHSGGELVYRHGAAAAHVPPRSSGNAAIDARLGIGQGARDSHDD